MPSAFDILDAAAATVIYEAVAVPATYLHTETQTSDAVTVVDFPDVQQAPSGFDGYAVVSRHEIGLQHGDLSSPPLIGDEITFEGASYRIDDIVADDEIEITAVIVEMPC